MPYGYHGKVLHVNLTSGTLEIETPPDAFYRTYMGGSALAMWYLLNEMPPGAEPLGPDNVLVFALSVLTGTPVHGQSRATAAAKSPLTGAVGDSQAGGFWPAEMKFAGFDAVVVKGASEHPVYLWLHEGKAELRDASHLWGTDSAECWDAIRAELDDLKIEVSCIGQAGEKLSRMAAIMNMANRAHGRTGMGAVMGSKKLKAIAVRGKMRPEMADRDTVTALSRWGRDKIKEKFDEDFGKYGTSGIVSSQNFNGGLPTHNYASGVFTDYRSISGKLMYETIQTERDTCYACATKCKRVVAVEASEYGSVDPRFGGPEYETIATFGSYCDVGSIVAVAKANEMCNRYGLDTISAGATISWAMEAYENGLLPQADEAGIALRFGDGQAMLQALEAMALRRGPLGDLLAEGSEQAARLLNNGSDAFLLTVKGQEAPAHMPQVKRSLGLIYAVNPFGADHESSAHDTAYTPGWGKKQQYRLGQLGLN
nr:aldehyde ferredoxin oxidoreductase [Ardenticatenales bacterium]